jgi:hypothetical protein
MASSSSSSLVRPKPRSRKTATTTATDTNTNNDNQSSTTNTRSSSKDKNIPKQQQQQGLKTTKPKAIITHSNTDSHCLPEKHNRVQHWLYLARLYNGFYMLTAREQFFCHIAGWMVAVMAGLYFYVFVRGFMDGFHIITQAQQHNM